MRVGILAVCLMVTAGFVGDVESSSEDPPKVNDRDGFSYERYNAGAFSDTSCGVPTHVHIDVCWRIMNPLDPEDGTPIARIPAFDPAASDATWIHHDDTNDGTLDVFVYRDSLVWRADCTASERDKMFEAVVEGEMFWRVPGLEGGGIPSPLIKCWWQPQNMSIPPQVGDVWENCASYLSLKTVMSGSLAVDLWHASLEEDVAQLLADLPVVVVSGIIDTWGAESCDAGQF